MASAWLSSTAAVVISINPVMFACCTLYLYCIFGLSLPPVLMLYQQISYLLLNKEYLNTAFKFSHLTKKHVTVAKLIE